MWRGAVTRGEEKKPEEKKPEKTKPDGQGKEEATKENNVPEPKAHAASPENTKPKPVRRALLPTMVSFGRADGERGDPFAIFKKPLKRTKTIVPDEMSRVRRFLAGKSRHFNFIIAHYIWIVGLTFLGSFIIVGAGRGNIAYIDALFLSSGANTQAGLNTVDVNTLTTFQQVVLYLLAMTSNPITINTSVVFLRLYWFEKHFQDLVREARNRRAQVAKSRSRARNEFDQAEQGGAGVVQDRPAGENPYNEKVPRSPNADSTNGDGQTRKISFASAPTTIKKADGPNSSGSTAAGDANGNGNGNGNGIMTHNNDTDSTKISGSNDGEDGDGEASGDDDDSSEGGGSGRNKERTTTTAGTTQQTPGVSSISFAKTVKRSDGEDNSDTKFSKRKAEDHIAILERQRKINNEDDEVLRIPNPRDAERGIGPKRVEEGDAPDNEDEDPPRTPAMRIQIQEPTRPADPSPAEQSPAPSVNPTPGLLRRITTFRMPRRRKRDDMREEASAIGHILTPFSFFKKDQERTTGPMRSRTFMDVKQSLRGDTTENTPYLSWTPTMAGQMGRNSQFRGLSLEQREELGGIEYRSLRTLAVFLLFYFWGFSIIAICFLLPYIYADKTYGPIPEEAGVSKSWWAFFTANSAFTDLGFTLTPDSMISFQQSALPLVVMSFLIFAGNSAFPVILRFCLWVFSMMVPKSSGVWEEVRFLLDHPRRCFTLLFPSSANWWLFWVIFGLNVLDLILFVVLDLNNASLAGLSVGQRIYNGLFLAASTRTAGFASVNVVELHPAVQTSYMIMMYISVFPIAISIRRTNVYEERSLGIQEEYIEEEEQGEDGDIEKLGTVSYMGNHLRRQLSFDLWYVFAGLFILSITEGGKIASGEIDLFGVMFEVISAYGTVGLSLGFPGLNASMSAGFSTLGKLVIILMQIRGRHRGLPYGLDRAIMLPTEERLHEETQEAPALSRVATGFSTGTGLQRRTTAMQRRQTMGQGGPGGLRRMPTSLAEVKVAGAGIKRSMTRSMTSMLMPGPPPPPRPRSSGVAARSFDRRAMFEEGPGGDDGGPVSPRGTRRGSSAAFGAGGAYNRGM